MHIEAHPMESLAAELDYTLDGSWGKTNLGFISTSEEHVWCNWCQCEVRPQLFAMRQHRRVCTTDPRIAGAES
jgi:hypothetical protein